MLTEYGKLLESFKKREEGARLSNLKRKDQISEIYSDIIKRYEPGGAFGAGYEQQLGRQKVHDVGASAQRDIGRGLYGIRPYEQEWEATTGASGRLKLEDLRMERLSGAQTGMAGFLERVEEPYPDYSQLLAASQAQGASYKIPKTRPQPTGGGGSSYGEHKPPPGLGPMGYTSSADRQAQYDKQFGTGDKSSGVGSSLPSRGGTAGGQGLVDPSKIQYGEGSLQQSVFAGGGSGYPTATPEGSLQQSVFAKKKTPKSDYEAWLNSTGKGITPSTWMQWNRSK